MEDRVQVVLAIVQSSLVLASLATWGLVFGQIRRRKELLPFEPRAQVPWTGPDVIVVGLGALLVQAAGRIVAEQVTGTRIANTSSAALPTIAATHLVGLAGAFAYLTLKARAVPRDLGLQPSAMGRDLRSAVPIFLASLVPVYGVFALLTFGLGWKSEHPLVQMVKGHPTLGMVLWVSVVAVLIAPVFEEFFFRVLLQGWLEKVQVARRQKPPIEGEPEIEPPRPGFAPTVIAAVLFGLLHEGPAAIALSILGLFLGYAYRQTHRLMLPVAIHAAVNAMAVVELWATFVWGAN